MKTLTSHPHETKQSHPTGCGCENCAPAAMCRNAYFTGKLLTARDFQDEQRYFLDKTQRHNLHLHGWGIVCGLHVVPHPYCPDKRIIITPGVAIDACGREIVLPEKHKFEIVDPDDAERKRWVSVGAECELPYPRRDPKPEEPEAPADGGNDYDDDEKPDDAGQADPQDDDQYDTVPTSITRYLCLHYKSCKTEFTPAPFDECGCDSNPTQANRICDSFKPVLAEKPPVAFEKAREIIETCSTADCKALFYRSMQRCPAEAEVDCIPLAIITWTPGEKVTVQDISDHDVRLMLPSTMVLAKTVRCLLDASHNQPLTRISDYNWDHRARMDSCVFVERYIGTTEEPRWFEVSFNGPLHAGGIGTRIFQATIIRYEQEGGPGRPEIAPSRVEAVDNHRRLRLRIDPRYGRTLRHQRFDVFLHLRCNFLIDQRGLAVDGNLLARVDEGDYVVPHETGDRIPGGVFETWIRVHH